MRLFDAIRDSLEAAIKPLRKIPHYGESGRAIEEVLRDVIGRHLPKRLELCTGVAVGTDGIPSHQADILVIDALMSPAFLRTGGAGLYPADGVLAGIEVTTALDRRKFVEDAGKVDVLRSLKRRNARVHWDSAPAGFLVAVEGPSKIQTCAGWLSKLFDEMVGQSTRWKLPGAVLIMDERQESGGLVCYWHFRGRAEVVSFNPLEADGVCFLPGSRDTLPVFLHLLTFELGRIVSERAKAVAAHMLLGPITKKPPVPKRFRAEISDAIAASQSYFPDLVSYFDAGILDRLSDGLVKVW